MTLIAVGTGVFLFGWLLGRAGGKAVGRLDGYNEGYADCRTDWSPKK